MLLLLLLQQQHRSTTIQRLNILSNNILTNALQSRDICRIHMEIAFRASEYSQARACSTSLKYKHVSWRLANVRPEVNRNVNNFKECVHAQIVGIDCVSLSHPNLYLYKRSKAQRSLCNFIVRQLGDILQITITTVQGVFYIRKSDFCRFFREILHWLVS